ncbi:DnaJ domain-containing protein [Clostridia bacterium]|nr:DnaJ domain-containing protein [Clostridia bacterium]
MGISYHDYYETLGINKEASDKEIKSAYRKLARKYHPDVNKDAGSEEKFKEINEAYEVLKDPDKRARYDQLGHNWQQGQDFSDFNFGGFDFKSAGGQSSSNFSDFFDTLFGNAGGSPFGGASQGNPFSNMYGQQGRQGYQPKPTPVDGADRDIDLTITAAEAYSGTKKSIKIRTTKTVNGKKVPHTHSLEIKIPPRATEGMKIKVPGKGNAGKNGGRNGNLYLKIKIKPGQGFTAEGKDLVGRVSVTPWDAVLGKKLDLRFFEETLEIEIPKKTQGGDEIRIKGKGLKNRTGEGDLVLKVSIKMPEHLSREEMDLLKQLKDAHEKHKK